MEVSKTLAFDVNRCHAGIEVCNMADGSTNCCCCL